MSNIPTELKYVKSHEWVKTLPDGSVLIGITDHAQAALGDLVFVETPKVGRKLTAGDACAVVESVKAASDVYAPISGEVLDTNPKLVEAPELLNTEPYESGWLWKMQPSNTAELAALLDAAGYAAALAAE
ncbi:MAG: glycine cleavage system protein GcvH [Nevskia sp.]|jgi:glycine cleavage system H protein|nr:glycine cleavage system protein GcvH [Nevskia sp.]